jgi:hypothetical protein
VLPWVVVPNLASHLLARCARILSRDWQALYAHPIYWIETFVDTDLFTGTCYHAANWTYLGTTTGRGKADQTHKPNRSLKAVWAILSTLDLKRGCVVDRREAETLYDRGKEPTVARLLEMDQEIQALNDTLASSKKNSTNSSKPPSSDGPEVCREKSTPTGRKPGAQDGHEGKHRELLPVEEIDHVHDLYPDQCEKCSLPLNPDLANETSAPFRHQVFEIPEIKPVKTEFRCHEIGCTCGHKTRAPLPPHVAQSSFGDRKSVV